MGMKPFTQINFMKTNRINFRFRFAAGRALTAGLLGLSILSSTSAEPTPTIRFTKTDWFPGKTVFIDSHMDSTDGWGRQCLDNITLEQTEKITGLGWQGLYHDDSSNPTNYSASPNTDEWQFSVWSDDEGKPGELLFTDTRPNEEIETTFKGHNGGPTDAKFYDFKMDFTKPFIANAATNYWVSILAIASSRRPIFSWTAGSIGERTLIPDFSGHTRQHQINTGKLYREWPGERAMTLYGVPINDADNDGMEDAWEAAHGLNPELDDAHEDPDEDGLANVFEYQFLADPHDADSDNDGLVDGVETGTRKYVGVEDTGTHPLRRDSDGDGYLDSRENPFADGSTNQVRTDPNRTDTDNDTYNDFLEITHGFNPNDEGDGPPPIIVGVGEEALSEDLFDHTLRAVFQSSEPGEVGVDAVFNNKIEDNDEACCAGFKEFTMWVQATFEEPIVLHSFTLTSGTNSKQDAANWWLLGSNDGIHFEPIYSRTLADPIWTKQSQVAEFKAGLHYPLPKAFRTLRFVSFETGIVLPEIEFFGETSHPKVSSVRMTEESQAQLEWESVFPANYTIETSLDLMHWETLRTSLPSNGLTTTYIDQAHLSGQRYYRVQEQAPLHADFETGAENWRTESNSETTRWEMGSPENESLPSAASGTHVWGTNLNGNFDPGVVATLQSPVIDLDLYQNHVTLWFNYYIDTLEGAAGGQVRILDESGKELHTEPTPITGKTEDWAVYALTLPESLQDEKVIIEFRFLSDGSTATGAGWYIDDVVVR